MSNKSFRCPDCNNILIPKPMTDELECKRCGGYFKRNKEGQLLAAALSQNQMKTDLRAMYHENPLLRAQMEAEEKAQAHKETEQELLETRMNVNEVKLGIKQKKKEYIIYLCLITFFSFAFAVVFASKFLHISLPVALVITAVSTILLINSYQNFKKRSSSRLKELKTKAKGLEFATYGDMNHD